MVALFALFIVFIHAAPPESSDSVLDSKAGSLIVIAQEIDPQEQVDTSFFAADTVIDTLPTITLIDSVKLSETHSKKEFIGSAQDVVLAVTSILVWLGFMWLAANNR
jgi:hypothetical protein